MHRYKKFTFQKLFVAIRIIIFGVILSDVQIFVLFNVSIFLSLFKVTFKHLMSV